MTMNHTVTIILWVHYLQFDQEMANMKQKENQVIFTQDKSQRNYILNYNRQVHRRLCRRLDLLNVEANSFQL